MVQSMSFQESQFAIQSFLPAIIGGTLGVLALLGMRELFKETSAALKKQIKA